MNFTPGWTPIFVMSAILANTWDYRAISLSLCSCPLKRQTLCKRLSMFISSDFLSQTQIHHVPEHRGTDNAQRWMGHVQISYCRRSFVARPFHHISCFPHGKSEIIPLLYSLKRQSDKSSVISQVLNQNEIYKENKKTKLMNESSNIAFFFYYLKAV